jgi:hypothetical protein
LVSLSSPHRLQRLDDSRSAFDILGLNVNVFIGRIWRNGFSSDLGVVILFGLPLNEVLHKSLSPVGCWHSLKVPVEEALEDGNSVRE